jgi:hypothetical protein
MKGNELSAGNDSQPPSDDLDQEGHDLHNLVEILLRTYHHFFGDTSRLVQGITDRRVRSKCEYPLESLFFTGILMYLCRLGSRRQIALQLRNGRSRNKMEAIFGIEDVPHGDTLHEAFAKLDVDEVQEVVTSMTNDLIRSKILDSYRLFGRLIVAIDGTGTLTFVSRHCPNCLTRKQGAKILYYHNVLEAKLVTPNGLVFSLMTEFIENESPDVSKQDCELRAFYRLAKRLRQRFPRLSVWLTLDGLFAGGPALTLCEEAGWHYTVVLKDGSLRSVHEEFRGLVDLQAENRHLVRTGRKSQIQQEYRWVNGIDYIDSENRHHPLSIVECLETDQERENAKTSKFMWVTSARVTQDRVREIAENSGRIRWKIENEGFNTQKTGGYELEHAYSENPTASKVFYFLLQIAHMIFQLLERGSLLKKAFPKGFGSLKNLARRLLDAWRYARLITRESLSRLFGQRIQIRLNTS